MRKETKKKIRKGVSMNSCELEYKENIKETSTIDLVKNIRRARKIKRLFKKIRKTKVRSIVKNNYYRGFVRISIYNNGEVVGLFLSTDNEDKEIGRLNRYIKNISKELSYRKKHKLKIEGELAISLYFFFLFVFEYN